MKTVISASRRTDIPAFYLDWFIEQIQQGYVDTTNPFNPLQKKRVSLLPQDAEWIVFWSRNYHHFIKKRAAFNNYNLFFHFTILPKSDFEKSAIPLSSAINQLKALAELYGQERIIWRYDPLIYWREKGILQTNHHIQDFEFLCRDIAQTGVNRCYISFVHPYKKFTDRIHKKFHGRNIVSLTLRKKEEIIKRMIDISARYRIKLYSCSNDELLSIKGIEKGHCINGRELNLFTEKKLVSEAKSPSRPGCGCTKAIDIGSYIQHPCYFGCIYCYANPLWK